ncbi:hypothetical protein [Streptomyces sasae]|uniref:hypothetical protein n=1 Tax=Streptomyces sasae TaxID=1266772 RepID=UPI00292D7281|nr:hypothetical protein [Streptomyces sasae]
MPADATSPKKPRTHHGIDIPPGTPADRAEGRQKGPHGRSGIRVRRSPLPTA